MFKVSVVIPVYKDNPSDAEKRSFLQCLNVLNIHPIVIVCPNSLDISTYERIASQCVKTISIIRFKDKYFSSVQGYNRLMLSKEFYETFINYEYILIYQLDSWVFSDELVHWCEKGYDYLGAPWFKNHGTHEQGNMLWMTGNGGFSLRKISGFLKLFYFKLPLFGFEKLNMLQPKEKQFLRKLRRLFVIVLKYFGFKNRVNYYIKIFSNNEDAFWSVFLHDTRCPLNIPKCEESLFFSFEKSPKYLFELSGERLPFGCHAWEKYQYDIFWKKYIK